VGIQGFDSLALPPLYILLELNHQIVCDKAGEKKEEEMG